ncbi:MAG: hypothetical protein HZB42_08170 [Sphingobacteriales bacterium]|nr:hypothetical protein [Sphingobacteriales bacterium]
MKQISFLSYISIFMLTGCTKDKSTNYYSYFENKTNHKIVVTPYLSGIIYPQNITRLNPGDKVLRTQGTVDGLTKITPISEYVGNGNERDSILVTFDDSISITHYITLPVAVARKYYLYSSNRNLWNRNSLNINVTILSKFKWKTEALYQFVEQDYLDAK